MTGSGGTVGLVLAGARGEALVQALRLVAEAEHDGVPRFPTRAVRALEIALTCRTYGPLLLELSYAVAAAALLLDGRYERLFWGCGIATADRLRALASDAARQRRGRDRVEVTGDEVRVRLDGPPFAVSWTRLPLLAAMLELLVDVLGYPAVDEEIARMLAAGPTRAGVGACANAIGRQLYRFLADQLPPAQTGRKLGLLAEFLRGRDAGRDTGPIDDALVLDFWVHVATLDADFRSYASVVQACHRFTQLAELGRRRQLLAAASPIGGDRAAGEVDPDAVSAAALAEEVLDRSDPLDALQGSLGAVKLLNRRELDALSTICRFEGGIEALSLSLLRGEVFGAHQARLTEALRRRTAPDEIGAMIERPPDPDYDGERSLLDSLVAHLDGVLLATVHVLAQARRAEGLLLLARLRPAIDLAALRPRTRSPAALDEVWQYLGRPEAAAEPAAAALLDARRAHRRMDRKGFGPAEIGRPEAVEAFIAGIEPLLAIRAIVGRLLRRLEGVIGPPAWRPAFDRDVPAFRRQFARLYGEPG